MNLNLNQLYTKEIALIISKEESIVIINQYLNSKNNLDL